MNRARKGSPRTFKMEPTGPKVPSRYLTGPIGSCHDNCKCETKPNTETKPKNPSPKRTPKPPAPNSVPRINKPPAIIPKSTTTTRGFKNNNVVKDQTLKKDVTNEPKKRDFKMKSVNSQAKTYNRPSSRTPSRRLSDICVPSNDMSLPSSRFPKRRLSEIIIHPKKDVASISNGSTGRGSGINKNESKKDSKLPLVNKKSNSLKTTVSTSKNNAKVSPLRTYKSLPKPEPKGPRKAKPVKPIEELVHEKTLNVIEPNNDVEITKSQSQRSPNRSPSSSEVKAMKDDQNGVVESLPPSVEDDTLAKDGHTSSAEVDAMKADQNEVVESSPPSFEDDQHEVVKTSPPLMTDDQNEVVESSPPSLEDDQHEAVNISPPSMEDDRNENEVVESSPPPSSEDDQHEAVKISPPSTKDDQNEVVEPSPPSMEDDTPAKDGQQNVEKLEEETNDCSLDDLAFRRGTILSPEAENKSLIEMQFKKGKELENETEEGENISLRRLSSDGAVCIAESVTISVDLKHQETEEKKAAVLSNNVIEETASKLIRARKSKVKALVGAFETIVSSESPRK
ncbi:putative Calmodulin-binding domain, plant [Helianthus annuus]|nr:putative Calmodulin-binding domain, plant [Helianthus annuus]KAJ0834262.1 putative Calmodulin-binding domain, plant [Helianthus annuus]